jgi:aldehyde dehydrogenase (NAD+)
LRKIHCSGLKAGSNNNFYPSSAPADGEGNFGRLASVAAYGRVAGLLKATKGTIVVGGETDEDKKYIAPTIVRDVKPDDSLMQEWATLLPITSVY